MSETPYGTPEQVAPPVPTASAQPPAYGAPPSGYSAPPIYGGPPPNAQWAGPSPKNGLGIAALTLGVIGAISGLIPIFFWLAGILGVLALIFGLIGRGRAKRGEATNKGQATAGFVLGIVAIGLALAGIFIIGNAFSDLGDDLECISDASDAAEVENC